MRYPCYYEGRKGSFCVRGEGIGMGLSGQPDCDQERECINSIDISVRIAKAIETTKLVVPGYFEKTLTQRAGLSGKAIGSIYPTMNEADLEKALLEVCWTPYYHQAIQKGCTAFKAGLPGLIGIIRLTELRPQTLVTLDDRKNTSNISAVVKGIRGKFAPITVLILGQEKGQEVVFTFHPGEPIKASQVKAETGLHGKSITVTEALKLGLEYAKIE